MSGANASPVGRSHQEKSGANASPVGRSHQEMSGANASPARSASAIARSLKKRRSHREMFKQVRFWKFWQFGMLVCFGIVIGVWAAAQVSVARQPLSNWMPAGALLYLESSDFATQLRDWNRSEVKTKWLASKNHEQFLTTRLVLKLKEGIWTSWKPLPARIRLSRFTTSDGWISCTYRDYPPLSWDRTYSLGFAPTIKAAMPQENLISCGNPETERQPSLLPVTMSW